MTITLYDFKMAPSPRRARVLLAEKGIEHDTVAIDLAKGEQMGEAYRQINPNCTLPTLKLKDGAVLTDNAGIAAYLEAAYPEPPLMGSTPLERAEIASWQSKIESEFLMGVASALRNLNPAMKDRALPGPYDYEQIPALAERGIAQVGHFLTKLETHLAGRDFIATRTFTIADITAGVTLDFARVIKIKPADEHPNVKRWHAALKERPSFAL